MISRLQVIPGPGTVARFGEVVVWAAPHASASLVTFLVESAGNVGSAAEGGTRITDHITAVLQARDPEPNVGFVALGPSARGTAVLLHGPVQAWDGRSWLVPQPAPGWLRTEVAGRQSIAVAAHGAPPPAPAASSDLRAGVVPAAGFALVAGADEAPTTAMPTTAGTGAYRPPETVAVPADESPTALPPAGDAAEEETTVLPPAAEDEATLADPPEPSAQTEAPAPTTEPPAAAEPSSEAPAGTVSFDGAEPLPALPAVGQPPEAVAGQPVVAAVRCPMGHLNHPASPGCVTCGRPIDPGTGQVSGPRPVLGVLLVDDGTVLRLDRSYLLGAAPEADPTVSGGRARPFALPAGPEVAPAHAEIRLTGWTVSVIDRGSPHPTLLLTPGASTWEALRPFVTTALRPGTHIAVGSHVLSLISPWPLGTPLTGA